MGLILYSLKEDVQSEASLDVNSEALGEFYNLTEAFSSDGNGGCLWVSEPIARHSLSAFVGSLPLPFHVIVSAVPPFTWRHPISPRAGATQLITAPLEKPLCRSCLCHCPALI